VVALQALRAELEQRVHALYGPGVQVLLDAAVPPDQIHVQSGPGVPFPHSNTAWLMQRYPGCVAEYVPRLGKTVCGGPWGYPGCEAAEAAGTACNACAAAPAGGSRCTLHGEPGGCCSEGPLSTQMPRYQCVLPVCPEPIVFLFTGLGTSLGQWQLVHGEQPLLGWHGSADYDGCAELAGAVLQALLEYHQWPFNSPPRDARITPVLATVRRAVLVESTHRSSRRALVREAWPASPLYVP